VDLALLVSFLAAVLLVELTPRLGRLLVIANGITRGARAGVAAAFGAVVGRMVHTLAAALGLACCAGSRARAALQLQMIAAG
jgi:threonine/homoserine/homoserine lactone efflux protein